MEQPNFSSSFLFLQILYPRGPWMLTAVSTNKREVRSKTFGLEDDDDRPVADRLRAVGESMRAWLTKHSEKNLYYSVNQPRPSAYESVKLSKTDVLSAHFLHVDVDPRAGEDLASEHERILRALQSFAPRPSVVVFSGGGYNALWRLTRPVLVGQGPEETSPTEFERRNRHLETELGADRCHDVCRILRLPGTVNRPTPEKVKRGRVEATSKIVWVEDSAYDYESFAASPMQISANAGSGSTAVSVDQMVVTDDLESLRLSDELHAVILQGCDPSDASRWRGNRSEALYWACCEMFRSGLDERTVLGIITDRRYLISASVLDKGSGMSRYAIRQVTRAKDHHESPQLREMNDRYAVIKSYGSSFRVMIEEDGDVVFQSPSDFKMRIKNVPHVQLPHMKRPMSAYDWWISHPRRREFSSVVFEPELETPGRYNLWTGFAVEPRAGDAHEGFLKHVHDVVCDGSIAKYEYLVRWMARVVQQPRTQSLVAPVLLGKQGVGKSMLPEIFGFLFGRHSVVVSSPEELTDNFNWQMAYCLLLRAEEAFDLRNKRHESKLKHLISGASHLIEKKGVDKTEMSNYVHMMMTSNADRVVPAGDDERRYFVMRVSPRMKDDHAYFQRVYDAMQREGGLGNLLHHLKTVDLGGWNVRQFPDTDELRRQQEYNLSAELEWLLEKLTFGRWLDGVPADKQRWTGPIRTEALHDDYVAHMTRQNVRVVRGRRGFFNLIVEQLPGVIARQITTEIAGDRPRAFFFPTLERCREIYQSMRGWRTYAWPAEEAAEEPFGELIQLPGARGPFE